MDAELGETDAVAAARQTPIPVDGNVLAVATLTPREKGVARGVATARVASDIILRN